MARSSSLRDGAKPTINDVARVAGVSKKTVSRVINRSPQLTEATREKVEAAIAQLGFAPNPQARALALGHSALVALVCARQGDGAGAPCPLPVLLRALDEAMAGSDEGLVVSSIGPHSGPEALGRFLARHHPRAVLLAPPLDRDEALLAVCADHRCPPLSLAPLLDQEREGVREAVAGLVARGHRRIGFIAGPDGDRHAQAREMGYLDAMADHGLDRGPALIETGDWSLASGHAAAQVLLEVSPAPTVIVAAGFDMACGTLQAVLAAGLAKPGQIGIVSCGDGGGGGALAPWLTTIPLDPAPVLRAALQAKASACLPALQSG